MGETEEKEQEATSSQRRGGSKRGRIDKRKSCEHKLREDNLNRDYFGDNPRFRGISFRRRFPMSEARGSEVPWGEFTLGWNETAVGWIGFPSIFIQSTLLTAVDPLIGLLLLTTSTTADAIEECQKLCSGHGYLCNSGLPEIFIVYVHACTYEGDNVVLLLQVTRFLMKIVSQLGSGKQPVGTTAYMGRGEHLLQCYFDVQQAEDWLKPTTIFEAFEATVACMSVSCTQNISKMPSQEEGFAELSSNPVETAVAHFQLIVVSNFTEKLEHDISEKGVKEQLQILCNIYALFLLHKHQDHYLCSVLGRYDGNVYPILYAKAWEEALNDTAVPDVYHEYIQLMLKQQLRTVRL
ncbi:hypothetical protein GIB67_001676 [Kingdonia uniflora]|uniref:Uncharacterized protein n=1 Tax=Kingdonia uniflora TaxID=39325 RepID=A0A7J7LMV1_9MAGN|nr:hypothetical protein GIB67_001676 [Kingdonia uniflora]